MTLRRSKYGNKRTTIDGISFMSVKEARRYVELKALERGGVIRELELQPRFPIIINGVKVFTYVADFRYTDGDQVITEDVKGHKTDVYKLKKKAVEAQYGISIRET